MGGIVMGTPFHVLLSSALGTFGIIWQETEKGPKAYRVLLPDDQSSVENLVQIPFADSSHLSCPVIAELGERIQSFLAGEAVDFGLDVIALEKCSEFQKRVLLAVYKIPRGWVSTYGRIAGSLEVPGGARAVGRALSCNPFPIIVPCHRVIRSNGELGGFGGGLRMKQTLLELEGMEFSGSVKVPTDRIHY
jgi:methylated-DNA-[protein]-cysteine S-methyltransferase